MIYNKVESVSFVHKYGWFCVFFDAYIWLRNIKLLLLQH